MRLDNKGFAISSILYSIMVLFLLLLLSILGMLGSRKANLDKTKKDILDELNRGYVNNKFTFSHRNIVIVNSDNKDDIVYALMDGVKALDENGLEISSDNISYDLNLDNIENKEYIVTYKASNKGKEIIGTRKVSFTDLQTISTYSFSGKEENFNPKYDGNYKIEAWGASGGNITNSNSTTTYYGGKGAYTMGNISLKTTDKLFIYVGGAPTSANVSLTKSNTEKGGYNGGADLTAGQGVYGAAGGGATDVRLVNGTWDNFDSLKSRIMVAGGGGGANYRNDGYGEGNGGAGGTLTGLAGESVNHTNGYGYALSAGGTQTSGGVGTWVAGTHAADFSTKIGTFGNMGVGTDQSGSGSGYYGGSLSSHGGAGGGSSFISGYDGCDAIDKDSTASNIIHTNQATHYSGYKFNNSVMYAGNEEMPNHDGTGKMTGNEGNGYAKISLVYYYL